MFDQRRYMEEYDMDTIEHELNLGREQLALLALALGSDYTEGIGGVGVVNAMELVSAFRSLDDLRAFKRWFNTPASEVLLSSHETAEAAASQYGFNEKQIDFLRDSCKRIKKHWVPPDGFPNERVVDAYLKPTVDRSKEDFEWGKPDMDLLRLFCKEKFGWEADRAERTLQDVLKHWEEHKRQRLMTEYVQASYQQRFAKVGSKRLKRAVQHLSGADAANDVSLGQESDDGGRGKQQRLNTSSGGRGSSRPARSADPSQHGKRTLGEADDGRNAASGKSAKQMAHEGEGWPEEPGGLTPVLRAEPERKHDQPQSTGGRTAILDDGGDG